jgi:hypothetical protein
MSDKEVNSGWISIYRKIRNHWIWQDPMKFQRWIDLLLEVNHTGKKVNIGYVIIECDRGQTVRSLGNWAKRWKCSKSSAKRFLELLEKDQMIVTENVSRTTRISVCNYNDYQIWRNDDETMVKRSRNDGETIAVPNNNDNNDNKVLESNPKIENDVEKKINKKEFEFKESIKPFISKYGKDICNNFFLYWSEPNKSKTKLRYEMEKTWDVKRRLTNWANRDKAFNTRINGTGAEPHYQKL